MKMIALITHNVHPELIKYLKSVKTVNPAEVSTGSIVMNIVDSEAIPSDVRAFSRKIEEINRVMDQVGHHELAHMVLSGQYFDKASGVILRKNSLSDRLSQSAGRDLTDAEVSRILNIVTIQLKLRIISGQKNSFDSVLRRLNEAVSKITI